MKTILLKSFFKKDSHYEVGLGNGTVHRFTNKKAALHFLADSSRFLNERLFTLNQLLIDVYPHMREIWLLNCKAQFDRDSDKYIQHVTHFLKYAVDRSEGKSGPYISFINLRKASETLKILCKHLQTFDTVQRTDTTRRHKLNMLFERAQLELMKIQNYALNEAFNLVDTSRYEDQNDIQNLLKIA